jgi:hypothetical protein
MQEAEKRIANWIKSNNPSTTLDLSGLHLAELPQIPANCQRLYCYWNELTSLPPLPNCKMLACCVNKLTVLPELPNCEILECEENQLITLPKLPNCRRLYCRSNKLTVLPELSQCRELMCENNKYLWITKRLARKHNIKETPNYTKSAKVIQRNYRRYIIRKYKLLDKYLLRDTIKVVSLYL